MSDNGLILVISGPSGCGKGSIIKPYMKKHKNCEYSVSITTRSPRNEDIDGVTYHFKSKEEVEKMILDNQFLEWDNYCGNYYGTPSKFVEETISSGKDCILEITVPGALNIKKNSPDCVMIFIAPPDLAELKRRIIGRGTEDINTIDKRMEKAEWELKMMEHYDYVIINKDVDTSISELEAIVTAERLKIERNKETLSKIGLRQEERL